MKNKVLWADHYITNKVNSKEALSVIKSGQRIFLGSSCGEPQAIIKEFLKISPNLTDLEIVRLLSVEDISLASIASKTEGNNFKIRSFYPGSASLKKLSQDIRFVSPINLSDVPKLFMEKHLPIDVALIQVSPPDDFGWMSLGISVDITLSATLSADIVIAQVNSNMPRVMGRSFIHANDIDFFVEEDEELLCVPEPKETDVTIQIGKVIANYIEDASTMHIAPGLTKQAIMLALQDKNDIGIHTEYLTDTMMHLFSQGIITNKFKGNKDGKIVAGSAIGTKNLYEFLHDNPSVDFQPSDYVNDPVIIAKHNKMVSLNTAMAIDITGQVAAEAFPYNYFTGITGMQNFARGAAMSKGGKSMIIMPSTNPSGTKSRIVCCLKNTAVVLTRADVQYVATEYGLISLFGKNLEERANSMISIAHPKFRQELFEEAKKAGIIATKKVFTEALKSIYPAYLEEKIEIEKKDVLIRPVRPTDTRRLQEHYYGLGREDVIARFFREKVSFLQSEVKPTIEINYKNDLVLIAVVGKFGFSKIIAVAEYYLNKHTNLAEISFSVNKKWQHKGISKIMLKKLYEAAKKNKFKGLMAVTNVENKRMVNLFKNLPHKIKTEYDADIVTLYCIFDETKKI